MIRRAFLRLAGNFPVFRSPSSAINRASSLSDLKNRSGNVTGRGQILTILKINNYSIDRKNGEIWAGQTLLQPISFKSDRLLGDLLAATLRPTTQVRAEYE